MHISKTTVLNLPQKKKRVRKHSFFLPEVLNQKFFKIFCFFKIREERSDDPPRGGADERSGATTGSGRPHAAPAAPIGGNPPRRQGGGGTPQPNDTKQRAQGAGEPPHPHRKGERLENGQRNERRLAAGGETLNATKCIGGRGCPQDRAANF